MYVLEKFTTDVCGWWVGIQRLLELLLKSKTSKAGTAYARVQVGICTSEMRGQALQTSQTAVHVHHKHVLELCDFLWARSNGVGNQYQLFDMHNYVMTE